VDLCTDGVAPAADLLAPRSDAERLRAALEALAARDQVLASRTRRLAALEDAEARLAAVCARLREAEAEADVLRRAREVDVGERDLRVAALERLLAATPAGTDPPLVATPEVQSPEPADRDTEVTRLRQDLALERRRNFRLTTRDVPPERGALPGGGPGPSGPATDAVPPAGGPGEAYAHWEDWFRHRLAVRSEADLERAEAAVKRQHAVLEEKERLIALLIDRLRSAGQVQEGPDDLKEVVGIGPVIEGLLHSLGITTFEQLAGLSAEDEHRIGEHLGVFRERIRRDGWAEQAAELARRRTALAPGLSLAQGA